MVKKGYFDEIRFIPILVIKMELIKKFMGLILTPISSLLILSGVLNRKVSDLYGKFVSLCFPAGILKRFKNCMVSH